MNKFQLNIQFDDESKETAEVWVDGKINSNPTNFLFDTGCAKTSVAYNDYTSSLTSLGSHVSKGSLANTTYDLISLPHLQVGPITKENIQVTRAQKGQWDRNLLGMDILRDYCLEFDFSLSKIGIISHINPEVLAEDLILDKNSIPYVDLQCGEQSAKAVWDTGASITLVNLSFVKKNISMFKKIGSTNETDSAETNIETSFYEMQKISMSGKEFPPHPVVAVDLAHLNTEFDIPMDFILGHSTLSKAKWVFDFPRKKWGFLK